MSITQVNSAQNSTLYQKLQASKPVQFAKDNKVLTAATLGSTAVIGHHLVSKSELAATVLKKGLVPVLGAGVATLGGVMIHDAVTNSEKSGKDRLVQGAEGAAAMLLGSEIAGHALNIKALQPVTNAAKFLAAHKEATFGVAVAAGSLAGAGYAVKSMADNGLNLGNAMGLTAGLTAGTGFSLATAVSVLGPESKAIGLIERGGGGLIGAGLGVTAVALGKETYGAIKEGKSAQAVFYGLGTAAAGIGGAHLLGNATGIPALANIGGKLIGKNPVLAGAIAITALGVGSYLVYNQAEKAEKK